jgi:hypothetical protein
MSGSALSGFNWPSRTPGASPAGQSTVSLSPSSAKTSASSTLMSYQPIITPGSSAPPVSLSTALTQPTVTLGRGAPSSSLITVYVSQSTVTSCGNEPPMSQSVDSPLPASIQPIGLEPVSQPGVPANGSSGPRTVHITVTSTINIPYNTPITAATA